VAAGAGAGAGAGGNASAVPQDPNCGKPGYVACATADNGTSDALFLLIEGRVAQAIAFIGVVLIVRSANKYARE